MPSTTKKVRFLEPGLVESLPPKKPRSSSKQKAVPCTTRPSKPKRESRSSTEKPVKRSSHHRLGTILPVAVVGATLASRRSSSAPPRMETRTRSSNERIRSSSKKETSRPISSKEVRSSSWKEVSRQPSSKEVRPSSRKDVITSSKPYETRHRRSILDEPSSFGGLSLFDAPKAKPKKPVSGSKEGRYEYIEKKRTEYRDGKKTVTKEKHLSRWF